MLLHHAAKTISYLSTEYIFIVVITYGFICLNKDKFARAALVMLFSVIFANYLKSIWQISLPPELGKEGWSFPSGHALPVCSFWLWLSYEYRSKAMLAIVTIAIALIGWSFVYLHYHYPIDIFGSLFFALLLLLFHKLLLDKLKLRLPYIGILYALIGFVLIYLIPKSFNHLWTIEGALIGFSLGLYLQGIVNLNLPKRRSFKLILFILAIKSIVTIVLIEEIFIHALPGFVILFKFLAYFTIGLWISFLTELIYHLLQMFYQYYKRKH